ncbi:hypothetical protein NQ318_005074 [Aromia moschata]|uniref:Glucose-methanol-choline oxidoreductase N-terminal domain-containing protein n=1 Tax=Aromia moschata TaxID=1265417 RepID=A0AAV8YE75_9CUCU|nr:hypothetical protein NQ318_005074 [Aromia moschata]
MCEFPRGKVLGGSSTINGKFYARGHRVDYDNWERLGNDGWSFKEILPYFIKSENSHISDGDPGYHGKGGYLDVSYIEPTIFTQLYLNAMKDLGYETIDYNGRKHIGASRIQFTINGTKIASGGRAFIQPVICRNNLNVTFNAFVTKLLINNNDKSAYGVQFTKDGKIYTVNASKEVILSAGAVNTPQILMVSGIGPKEELDKIEVDTLLDLPVGRYMQDHPFFTGINVRTNVTLFNESLPNLISAYLRGHRPLTSPANMDTTGFFNVNDRNSTFPDIQHIVFVPPAIGRQAHVNTSYVQKDINKYSDVLLGIILLHPKSRGSITLKSKNPIDFPNADYNFFTDPEEIDISTMYKGILETLRLLETAPFKSVNATYIPYVKICTEFPEQSKEYWYCAIRYLTSTIYHPVGTTKMGISPRNSVVSSKLVVHGMKKLRIVDAGVMPEIPSANTMAPTYMIAEKAADLIKNCYQTV